MEEGTKYVEEKEHCDHLNIVIFKTLLLYYIDMKGDRKKIEIEDI